MDEPEKDEASKLSEKEKTSVMWKLYRRQKSCSTKTALNTIRLKP